MATVKVLIDCASAQAKVHLDGGGRARPGTRLAELVKGIGSLRDFCCHFTAGPTLAPDELRDCDVLIEPTRLPACPFGDDEIGLVETRVRSGMGLILLSNHGDTSGGLIDLTAQDRRLAEAFGIEVRRVCFRTRDRRIRMETFPNPDHPIIRDGFGSQKRVRSLVVNNCCGLRPTRAEDVLVALPPEAVEEDGRAQPSDLAFAVASTPPGGDGRVVVVADSGFLGSRDTNWPGPGLLDQADNLAFALKAVLWTSGRR